MKSHKFVSAFCLIVLFSVLTGCATVPDENNAQSARVDPFERLNRSTAAFNDKFDENLYQPVARVYANTLPSFVKTGIGNFFGNINDIWTAVNSMLQGNVQDGFSDLMRVSLNSTLGIFGILDIASEAKIPKHRTDLGQTLGVWGVPNGPYLVIPFLGPSVVRDAAALPVDYYADLWSYYRPVSARNTGTVIRLVDKRASYLDSYNLLEDAALDKYIFIRDVYLQRVSSQIEARKNARKNHKDEEEMQKQEDDNATKELLEPETSSDKKAD